MFQTTNQGSNLRFFACLCSSDNQFGDKNCAKSECITRLQRTLNFSFPASTNHSPVLRSGRSAASRPASWRGKVTELILVDFMDTSLGIICLKNCVYPPNIGALRSICTNSERCFGHRPKTCKTCESFLK